VSTGYELEVSGEVAPGWALSVGWTQFSAKHADGADVAVDHARKMLKFFTTYRLGGALQGLSVGGGVNWERRPPDHRGQPRSTARAASGGARPTPMASRASCW